jgi:hypothetical protein
MWQFAYKYLTTLKYYSKPRIFVRNILCLILTFLEMPKASLHITIADKASWNIDFK